MKTCVNTGSFRDMDILTSLEILSVLGMKDIELNLRPVIDEGIKPEVLKDAINKHGFNVVSVAGGWCDFFTDGEEQTKTTISVNRQIELAEYFGSNKLRLFFGLLDKKYDSVHVRETVVNNVRSIAELHPEMIFLFENHDHLSLDINFLDGFFISINLPNVKLNYDAVNFERGGTNSVEALKRLLPLVEHVHVKGKRGKDISPLAESEYNFNEVFEILNKNDYRGYLSLEYEAGGDIISNLYNDYKFLKNQLNQEK